MTKSFDIAKQIGNVLSGNSEVKIIDQSTPTNSWRLTSVGNELLISYNNGTTTVLKAKVKPDGTVLAATDVGII